MNILVVDDEKNMRLTLAAILEEEGYSVTEAATGDQAVERCEQQAFDVVLMDVHMPGLNGVDAFRKIRRHQEGIKVILMSAYVVDDLKRVALDEGAVAFLSKPLNLQRVINLIQDVQETAILVVEDDQDEGQRIHDKLRDQGYRVTVATSPHDALELVEQIRFDIVLIDVALPAMTGLELYLAIKHLTPTTLAIMMSGLEEEFEKIAREAVRQTAYTILQKPLDLDHLLSLLTRISGQQASNAIHKPPQEPLSS
ncbi:MAG: response regulator [Nitrospirae bacterium]|nr:response regulator [Nitrospirota bacterium]MDA1303226.1 response regulator [Nitrospirota bacterium]